MGNRSSVAQKSILAKTTKKIITNPDVRIVKKEAIDYSFIEEVLSFKRFLQKVKINYNIANSISKIDQNELYSNIDKHFNKISNILRDKNTSNNNSFLLEHKKYYQSNLVHFFLNFNLGRQAYVKPFGYPGDYKVINYYYKGSSETLTFFDHLLDQYTIHHTSCGRGVQNRITFIKQFIVNLSLQNKSLNILNVAAGPAEEVRQLILEDKISKKIKWNLLDIDKQALTHIKTILTNQTNVKYIHENVFNFIRHPHAEKYDLIYSLGLFDYFNNISFKRIMNKLFKLLNDSGVLIIGNLSEHEHKTYMELLADWNLYYRSSTDLIKIANDNNYGCYSTITTEDNTQNYLIIYKQ